MTQYAITGTAAQHLTIYEKRDKYYVGIWQKQTGRPYTSKLNRTEMRAFYKWFQKFRRHELIVAPEQFLEEDDTLVIGGK